MGLLYLAHLASLPVVLWLVAADLREHRLPDSGTLPLLAGTYTVSVVLHGPMSEVHIRAVAASAFTVLVLWLLHELPGHPLGFGDVKLGASFGLQCGWWDFIQAPVFLAVAFVAGGLVATAHLMMGRISPSSHLAFGPYLLIGWWVVLAAQTGSVR